MALLHTHTYLEVEAQNHRVDWAVNNESDVFRQHYDDLNLTAALFHDIGGRSTYGNGWGNEPRMKKHDHWAEGGRILTSGFNVDEKEEERESTCGSTDDEENHGA